MPISVARAKAKEWAVPVTQRHRETWPELETSSSSHGRTAGGGAGEGCLQKGAVRPGLSLKAPGPALRETFQKPSHHLLNFVL